MTLRTTTNRGGLLKLQPVQTMGRFLVLRISVRLSGGTYIARCENFAASSTSAAEFAASAVAAKRFGCGQYDMNILLKQEKEGVWLAVPRIALVACSRDDIANWKTAVEIVQAQSDRLKGGRT